MNIGANACALPCVDLLPSLDSFQTHPRAVLTDTAHVVLLGITLLLAAAPSMPSDLRLALVHVLRIAGARNSLSSANQYRYHVAVIETHHAFSMAILFHPHRFTDAHHLVAAEG